jgi:hypothetical protein
MGAGEGGEKDMCRTVVGSTTAAMGTRSDTLVVSSSEGSQRAGLRYRDGRMDGHGCPFAPDIRLGPCQPLHSLSIASTSMIRSRNVQSGRGWAIAPAVPPMIFALVPGRALLITRPQHLRLFAILARGNTEVTHHVSNLNQVLPVSTAFQSQTINSAGPHPLPSM